MATPTNKSYAEALSPQVRPENSSGVVEHNIFRPRLSSDNNASTHRASITQVQAGPSGNTGAYSSMPPPPRSMTNSPSRSIVSSSAPRRSSIAQVFSLSRVTSRPSLFSSEEHSGVELSSDNLADLESRNTVRARQMKRNKKSRRRRKPSQTQDHGDFISSNARSMPKPPPTEGTTDLLVAIANEDVSTVRSITDELRIAGPKGPDERALQEAALTGNLDIVKLLLDSENFDIDARDPEERTALYAAASRGHENVVHLLQERGAKHLSREESKIAIRELIRWREFEAQIKLHGELPPLEQTVEDADLTAEPDSQINRDESGPARLRTSSRGESEDGDHISKLEMSSEKIIKNMEEITNKRRRDLQKRGEWVAGPIINQEPAPNPSKDRKTQRQRTNYPGFGFEIPILEIDFTVDGGHRRVFPTPTVDQLLYEPDSITRGNTPTSSTTCRWYHIPANHLGWAEDLIKKIYENRPLSEKMKRDVILAREPFYRGDYDHTNSTLLDPRPQARSLRPICRNMTLDRAGKMKLSSALTMHIPYIHWETEENRAEMAHVMKEVRQARKYDIDNSNSTERAIPEMSIIAEKDWNKNEKMLCAYLYNNPPVHPRRTLDQFYYHMLEDTEQRDQDQVITRYYHKVWKRNNHFPEDEEESEFAMPQKNEPRFKFALNYPTDETDITQASSSTTGIHEHSFSDLVGMYASKQPGTLPTFEDDKKEEKHVLMVDQLWLWILDDNTIVSSFPQNWTHDDEKHKDEKDPLDVLQSILEYLTRVNRSPIESVHDLAHLIVSKCLATFCKKSTPYGPMQILDVYESAIASVTDKESKIFAKFAAKSKNGRSEINGVSTSRESPVDIYNIDEEIEQLKEIKDIQDELHILSVLLENQSQVLEQAAAAFKSTTDIYGPTLKSPVDTANVKSGQFDSGEVAPYSSENTFTKLQQMILEQKTRRKALEVQAEAANKALNHLLDLKQKQANVSEARSARWTAESTKQQGNIMVLFTLVTIIFAPLSLMVTIFSLRIVEFPVDLHMDYVLKYMFVVSLAVIVPLIGLVIYTTRGAIAHVFLGLEEQLKPRWLDKMHKKRRKKQWMNREDQDGDASSSTTDVMSRKEGIVKRRLAFWRKKKIAEPEDAEKAVTTDTSTGPG